MKKLTPKQLQILLDAWNHKVYQRTARKEPYAWSTRTDGNVTQQINRLYPTYVTLVDLPHTYGLNSRRYIPTHEGEELLIAAGRIDRP